MAAAAGRGAAEVLWGVVGRLRECFCGLCGCCRGRCLGGGTFRCSWLTNTVCHVNVAPKGKHTPSSSTFWDQDRTETMRLTKYTTSLDASFGGKSTHLAKQNRTLVLLGQPRDSSSLLEAEAQKTLHSKMRDQRTVNVPISTLYGQYSLKYLFTSPS